MFCLGWFKSLLSGGHWWGKSTYLSLALYEVGSSFWIFFLCAFFFYCFLFLNESYVSLIKRNEKKRKGKVFGSLDLESIFRRCSWERDKKWASLVGNLDVHLSMRTWRLTFSYLLHKLIVWILMAMVSCTLLWLDFNFIHQRY